MTSFTKKTQLLFISLTSFLFVMAQQRVLINDVAKIDFPTGTKKMSDEELQFRLSSFKKDHLKPTGVSTAFVEHYKIDSFVLTINTFKWNVPQDYLEERKTWINRNPEVVCTNCTSEIKNINNYTVLITTIVSDEWGDYFFSCVNKERTELLSGSIFFMKFDSCTADEALKTLYELLNGISLK